ncbi:MAG: rRNA maturation RNase YbeY [Desulfobacula sp.]
MAQQKILINNQQKKKFPTDKIRQKTKQILNALGCKTHEISILITDDEQIRELNRTYRGVDKPTNVLSFPMQEVAFSDLASGLLGDVVISLDTAQKEAENADVSLSERMSQLLIHGILHLVGFDHEKGEKSERDMEDKSFELLKLLEPDKDLPIF